MTPRVSGISLTITSIIILLTIAIAVVWHDVVVIMMRHIGVAAFVVAVVVMVVVNDITIIALVNLCDVVVGQDG